MNSLVPVQASCTGCLNSEMRASASANAPCNENICAKEGKTSDRTPTRAMQRKHTHTCATDEGKHKKRSASARHATTQRHANAHAQQTEANAKIAHGKNRSARQKIAPAKNRSLRSCCANQSSCVRLLSMKDLQPYLIGVDRCLHQNLERGFQRLESS